MTKWICSIVLALLLPTELADRSHAPRRVDPPFTDVTDTSGIGESKEESVAWGDVDGDGWEDLLLCADHVRLMKNKKDGTFTDATKATKLDVVRGANAGYFADIDNDGDLDLFLVPGKLLRNDKGVFTDISKKSGIPDLGDKYQIESAAWADFDGDGFVDLMMACMFPKTAAWSPAPVLLYKNQKNGTFLDVTLKAGLPDPTKPERVTRSIAFCDYDNDGDADIYVSCYRCFADYIFQNDGKGKFANVAAAAGLPQDAGQSPENGHELGVAWADFDRDGLFDVYTTPQHDGNRLWKNQGAPKWNFKNVAGDVGAACGENKWDGEKDEHLSCAIGDYDNDGWPDIYVGMEGEGGVPNQLLHNKGDGTFESVDSGVKYNGQGAAWCDYDHDGDLDLAAAGENSGIGGKPLPVRLLRNDLKTENHHLTLRLIGKKSNKSAIGARATVVTGTLTQMLEVDGGSGSRSQNSLALEFGLGAATKIDKLTVRWPTGKTQIVAVDGVDRTIDVTEN